MFVIVEQYSVPLFSNSLANHIMIALIFTSVD